MSTLVAFVYICLCYLAAVNAKSSSVPMLCKFPQKKKFTFNHMFREYKTFRPKAIGHT